MLKTDPEERHSNDVHIIPFNGRSQQAMHKWGFKVFSRAGTPGIMYEFEIHSGKQMKLDRVPGISGMILLRLTKDLKNLGKTSRSI